MPLLSDPIPWYIVYNKIAYRLLDFYNQHSSNAGRELFRLVSNSTVYSKQNLWLKNTSRIKIPSIEPIQLFASFSRAKQTAKSRITVINEVWKLLEGKESWETINFEGCPTPMALKLHLIRPAIAQGEIWDTFADAMTMGRDIISEKLWEKVKNWKGIGIPSFTIFLFWIRYNEFIPLDTNTRMLLEQEGFLNPNDRLTFDVYQRLLDKMYKINLVEFSTKAFSLKPIRRTKHFIREESPISFLPKFDFKLIGIRVLNRNKKVHKVLKPYEYYALDRTFEPVIGENKNTAIGEFVHSLDQLGNLYSLPKLNVRINAIVGKNGSGKSSLLDLILMGIHNLSLSKNILDNADGAIANLNFELYWFADTLYKLQFGKDIVMHRFKGTVTESGIRYTLRQKPFPIGELHSNFFYSVLINYSHYALNSLEWKPDWVSPLSLKNDGYKVPVVVNPQRKEGNIDINKEKELLNMRLLVNLLTLHDEQYPSQSFRNLDNGKTIKYFSFFLNKPKIEAINKYLAAEKFTPEIIRMIVDKVESAYKIHKNANVPFREEIERYIVYKLSSLVSKYEPYITSYEKNLRKYLQTGEESISKGNQKRKGNSSYKLIDLSITLKLSELIESLLSDVKDDESHVTLKLRQAINYLRHPKVYNKFKVAARNKGHIDLDIFNQPITDIRNIDGGRSG